MAQETIKRDSWLHRDVAGPGQEPGRFPGYGHSGPLLQSKRDVPPGSLVAAQDDPGDGLREGGKIGTLGVLTEVWWGRVHDIVQLRFSSVHVWVRHTLQIPRLAPNRLIFTRRVSVWDLLHIPPSPPTGGVWLCLHLDADDMTEVN